MNLSEVCTYVLSRVLILNYKLFHFIGEMCNRYDAIHCQYCTKNIDRPGENKTLPSTVIGA